MRPLGVGNDGYENKSKTAGNHNQWVARGRSGRLLRRSFSERIALVKMQSRISGPLPTAWSPSVESDSIFTATVHFSNLNKPTEESTLAFGLASSRRGDPMLLSYYWLFASSRAIHCLAI